MVAGLRDVKLAISNLVPAAYNAGVLREIARRTEDAVNLSSEGRLAGRHFNATTIPTTGDFAQGDLIWKSNLTEAGSVGSKYVVIGWCCTVAGSPGTLLEMRVLTGN